MFITFEGVEGSGKSTQAKKLHNYLIQQGNQVVYTREPGGTPIAEKIREILLNQENKNMYYLTELLLYAASRAQHIEELIKPALAEGKTVICDRFSDSTIAYQGYGRNIALSTIKQLNQMATQTIKPHLTFILDVPVEQGFKRIEAKRGIGQLDRLEQEDIDFHQKVRNGFLVLAKEEPERIKLVDGTQQEEKVFQSILKVLQCR